MTPITLNRLLTFHYRQSGWAASPQITLGKNTVLHRASASPWPSWLCLFLVCAAFLPAPPSRSARLIFIIGFRTFVWILSLPIHLFVSSLAVGPSRPFSKNYFHEASNVLISIRTPPRQFLQRLFLPLRPLKPSFFDKTTWKHNRRQFFGFPFHFKTGCLSVQKHFLPFF